MIFDYLAKVRKTFVTNFVRIYYSQFGEDTVLRELLGKKQDGVYVDVGCYHPKKYSNTYLLHKRGWSGVNIDMEEEKIALFRLARPHDYNVVAAISDAKREAVVFRDRSHSLGTSIVPGQIKADRDDLEELTVETKTLDEILSETRYAGRQIDVISIDCEGHDFPVLQSLSLKTYRPKIIIIESQDREIESIVASDMYRYLKSAGYRLRSWMHLSLLFVLEGSYADR
jgi:FkbM family methyltransferase